MNIQHYEKGFNYTDRELIQMAKSIGKLATYCKRMKDDGSFIRVDAEKRQTEKKKDEMKVMVTVNLPKKTLRAESRREEVAEAFDRCMEKLYPQVVKFKAMNTAKGRAQKSKR